MAGNQGRKQRVGSPLTPFIMMSAGTALLLFGIFGVWFLGQQAIPAAQAQDISAVPVKVAYPAPSLLVNDLQGYPVSLENMLGQVVLVNNWATWCPPCRAEMPSLEAYYQAHKENGFTLIAIDSGEPPDVVAQFVENYSLTFNIWLDPGAKALRAFRNNSLPSSYVIDREGVIRLTWTGAISQEMLEKYVTPLLEKN
jgi:cytochrome c biogenesis protein CcmG, thiol:disulfide interchange protein DsbE